MEKRKREWGKGRKSKREFLSQRIEHFFYCRHKSGTRVISSGNGQNKKEREGGSHGRKNGAILQNKRALQPIENQYRNLSPELFCGRKRVYSRNRSFLIFTPVWIHPRLPLTVSLNGRASKRAPIEFSGKSIRCGVSAGIKLATPETRWLLSIPLTDHGNVVGKTILWPARYRPPGLTRSGINISQSMFDRIRASRWFSFADIYACRYTYVHGFVVRCSLEERVPSFANCIGFWWRWTFSWLLARIVSKYQWCVYSQGKIEKFWRLEYGFYLDIVEQ